MAMASTMATTSRILGPALRPATTATTTTTNAATRSIISINTTISGAARSFHRSAALRQGGERPLVAPVRRPVGAFRGGLFGFLLGTATAGTAMYYYVVDEYRVSNQLLTEDVYALQGAVQRVEGYVRELEERVGERRR